MTKQELRLSAKKARERISDYDRINFDNSVFESFIKNEIYLKCQVLFIYVSSAFEVDTKRIISYALSNGKKVAVPRCNPDNFTMNFHRILSFDDLHKGYMGILEPSENLPIINSNKNSLMVVPMVCGDIDCNRIGYGGGFYDRYLPRFKGTTVGFAYNVNIYNKIITDDNDYKLDYVLTDKQLLRKD